MEWGALLAWLATVGTNGWVTGFIVNNILLFWIIAKITPGKKDDRFLEALKERLGMGKEKDVKEIKK